MDFIKKHYEKIILSLVLLGLAMAAAALPMKVSAEKQYLNDTVSNFIRIKPKPFPTIDLQTNRVILTRLESQAELELAGQHNLFNPVQWKRGPDGQWVKLETGKELGVEALQVMKVTPLYLRLTFEGVGGSEERPNYRIRVERETDTRQGRQTRAAFAGVRNDLFTIIAVRPEVNPQEFDILLNDEKNALTLSRDKPYTRVIGYAADLRYPPTDKLIPNQRVDDVVRLPDVQDIYKIVAIDGDEVVLSASSTQKRTTLRYDGAPAQ